PLPSALRCCPPPPFLPSFPTRRSSDLPPPPSRGPRPSRLFRSSLATRPGPRSPPVDRRLRPELTLSSAVASAPGWALARESDSGDRKSTRLNSSHQIISYAVFCLKKKI